MGFDEQSLTMQLTLLVAYLPVLATEGLCAGWALWRLHRRPREGWLLLAAIGVDGCQYLLATTAFSVILTALSLTGVAFSGEAVSLAFTTIYVTLSLISWWLIILGIFGPTPFQSAKQDHSVRTSISLPALLPIVMMTVSYAGVLVVLGMLCFAVRRQRFQRPRAARWTNAVIALHLVSTALPWLWSFIGTDLFLPSSLDFKSAVSKPEVWAFVARCWLGSIMPIAQWVIITYLVIEQPDAPPRPILADA